MLAPTMPHSQCTKRLERGNASAEDKGVEAGFEAFQSIFLAHPAFFQRWNMKMGLKQAGGQKIRGNPLDSSYQP